MLWCEDPYARFKRGDVSKVSDATQRVERSEVACGRCKACISNRKQDWTGKLLMEAQHSGSVCFLTLTYKDEPEEFEYPHVQGMLKSLRQKLARAKLGGVRFFCVGEKGELNGRKHWHLILFFQRNIQLQRTTEGELWEHWPHGWTSIEMLKHYRIEKKIRYCVMYCLKGVGFNPGVRARCSLKPALGAEYVARTAWRTAEKGLVPNGKYQLPGIKYTTGHKAGCMVDFTLQGANRRRFCEVYSHAWVQFHGDKRQPMSDWLMRWQADAVDPVHYRKQRATVAVASQPRLALAKQSVPGRSRAGAHTRYLVGDGWSAEIVVWEGQHGGAVYSEDRHWRFEFDISETLDLPRAELIPLEKWAAMVRGPVEARVSRGEEANKQAQAKRARSIALREVVEHARDRQRARHGTVARVGGVYGRPYNPALPQPDFRTGQAWANPVRAVGPHEVVCSICRTSHDPRRNCPDGLSTDYGLRALGLPSRYDIDEDKAASLPF